jgi:hypothetical protein
VRSASEPAEVSMRSPVSMLSLMSRGTPCSVHVRSAPVHLLDSPQVQLREPFGAPPAGAHPILQLGNGALAQLELGRRRRRSRCGIGALAHDRRARNRSTRGGSGSEREEMAAAHGSIEWRVEGTYAGGVTRAPSAYSREV